MAVAGIQTMRRNGAARIFGGHTRSGERELSAAFATSLSRSGQLPESTAANGLMLDDLRLAGRFTTTEVQKLL